MAKRGGRLGAALLAWWAQQRRRARHVAPYLVLSNPTDRIGMYVRGTGTLSVDWGDGTESSYTLTTGSSQAVTKVYGSAAARTVRLVGNVTYFQADGSTALGGAGSASFGGDVGALPGLTYLNVGGTNTVSGDISGLALTYLGVGGSNTVTGSITGMRLTSVSLAGNNTVGGSVTGMPLTYIYAAGGNTIAGCVTGMALTTASLGGNNTLSGDLTGMPLGHVNLGGGNTVGGDVGTLTGLGFLLENATCVVTHPATWINLKALGYVSVRNLTTPAAVDDLLVSMDANKNESKGLAYRTIICTVNCAAPSATGLAAKASLVAAGWTVTTN